ncbi:CAMK family protein kinase [Tritrichomonas foetus]|uniref:CAMK family protein kinase n=1 Tax=Tritrichomonas foetus TaxID=1144522 RepID=A0A1J4JY25_9EUKA|nr:CAMK family protein kinase [Tritrichomonas foetus]|eukprot:OHT04063.1 CAMK family protein kinase [Tritrichomonas foetus]
MQNSLTTDDGVTITFPSEFGSYRYISPIGEGSSAVVILVENKITNNLFAAKLLKRDKSIDKNLERELRFLQSMRHPNIISVYDIIYLPNAICVIMEYCPRGDLISELSAVGHFEPNTLRSYSYQIISALQFLHSNGWTHRDLKPDNILIDTKGKIKLTDFGHCGEVNKKDPMMCTLCGTYYYIPPEVMEEHPYDGKKADIWALGVVMYCMATGQLPWEQGSAQEVRERIMKGQIVNLPNIDKDCLRIVKMCIVVDPSKRATIDEIFDDEWFTPIALLEASRPKIKTTSKILTMSTTRFTINPRRHELKKHSTSLYNFTFS